MAPFLWIFLPVFIAAGSALLSFYIMQARLEVAVSKERESSAELRAEVAAQGKILDEKVKTAEESAQRKAFDTFLSDFRVEERHYMRESKSLFMNKKSMVLQERLFFRTIPLSNWIEHELVVEQGAQEPTGHRGRQRLGAAPFLEPHPRPGPDMDRVTREDVQHDLELRRIPDLEQRRPRGHGALALLEDLEDAPGHGTTHHREGLAPARLGREKRGLRSRGLESRCARHETRGLQLPQADGLGELGALALFRRHDSLLRELLDPVAVPLRLLGCCRRL